MIWLAYLAIPAVLIYFVVRRHHDLPFSWMFWMFGAFIVGCGFIHLLEVYTFFTPVYRLSGLVKAFTAAVSWATVLGLVPLVPKALALRSPEAREREIAEHERGDAELARRAQELDEKNLALLEAERLKSAFFAHVSHDLRTPLTLILAPLDSLLAGEYGTVTDPQRNSLQTVHNNAVRLLRMVTGLLDFVKLEAGKVEVNREPVQVAALTRAVLADFLPLVRQKGLAASFQAIPPEASVWLDRYLYERILFNLLSNAVRFTGPGGEVSLFLELEGDRLRLSVTDTGIGIAEPDLAELFQKFRQLEGLPTRRYGGTGLGLALVKEFAELLGGTVSVESTPGKGSIFTVECLAPASEVAPTVTGALPAVTSLLPKYEAGREKVSAPDSFSPPEAAGPDLPKVLIAEDNGELAAYIATLLHGSYHTRWAADGEEARQMVHQWSPDLVLADVMMPKRDGFSLCREVKADPATSRTPVVLLTAMAYREALLKGWEAGADEYLFKPFHPKELATRIKALLSAAHERQQAEKKIYQLNEELKQRVTEVEVANRELEAFSYSVSHDLRAPLRAMNGFSRILLEDSAPGLTGEARHYLQLVRDNAQQMGRLIDDLLNFSRLGRQALTKQRVAPAGLVRQVLEELATEQEGRRLAIKMDELPVCQADPALLKQVFVNLLANALKYTRRREEAVIEIGCRDDGDQPGERVYFVKDNGVGFDMRYVHKLFGVFQRLHRAEDYEGTGVGLATVQRIIHRHGGRVWAEAEMNRGATFYFTLENGTCHD